MWILYTYPYYVIILMESATLKKLWQNVYLLHHMSRDLFTITPAWYNDGCWSFPHAYAVAVYGVDHWLTIRLSYSEHVPGQKETLHIKRCCSSDTHTTGDLRSQSRQRSVSSICAIRVSSYNITSNIEGFRNYTFENLAHSLSCIYSQNGLSYSLESLLSLS